MSQGDNMAVSAFKKSGPVLYFIFRILVGFLFFSHGAMKLFGWFGGTPIAAVNLFWVVGLAEILIGLGVFFGVLTRIAAIAGAIEMIVAYIVLHIGTSVHPLLNIGESVVLFFVIFLILIIYGAGRVSLEKALFGRELI